MQSGKEKFQLYFLSSTHWDREWYLTFQAMRFRLADTLDELLDTMGLDDFQSAFAAVTQTTKDGLTPHVEVEPAKNAKTTPEK